MPSSVLVVDDDASFRALAARVLSAWGHTVVGHAGTLAEAVERSAAQRPEVVLVDIGLPDGNGYDLAEALAALPWQPRVVLVSSDPDAAHGAAARRRGAAGFVPKTELAGGSMRRLVAGE